MSYELLLTQTRITCQLFNRYFSHLSCCRSVQKNTTTGAIEVASVVYRVKAIETQSGDWVQFKYCVLIP